MDADSSLPTLADIGIGGLPTDEPQLIIHALLDEEGYSVIVYSKGRQVEYTVSLAGEKKPVKGRGPAVEGFRIYRPDELPQSVQAAVASMVGDFRSELDPTVVAPEHDLL